MQVKINYTKGYDIYLKTDQLKKRCSPVQNASVKKVVKSKGRPRNSFDGIG